MAWPYPSSVELMGGNLQLERSGPDALIFSFSIALPSADPSAGASGAEAQPELNGESALIVTNSPFGSLFLRQRLAELGFVVSCVPDEASAFEVLREKTPALAIHPPRWVNRRPIG